MEQQTDKRFIPDQCQICILNPEHCNGSQLRAETWDCRTFSASRTNLQKLIEQHKPKTPQAEPEDPTPEVPDNRLWEHGVEPSRNVWDDYWDAAEKPPKTAHWIKLRYYIRQLGRWIKHAAQSFWRILKLLDWHIVHSEYLHKVGKEVYD